MIELKNIDLTFFSKKEQRIKAFEEEHELDVALFNLRDIKVYRQITGASTPIEDEEQAVIEEFWDVVQAWLGVLAKEGITADKVMEGYPEHLEKIKNRPR